MLKLRFVLVLAICSIGGSSVIAQRSDAESDLKAAFIYNFTKYIEWDESEPNEFSIGVIGSSPTYFSLLEIAKKKTAHKLKSSFFILLLTAARHCEPRFGFAAAKTE